MTGGGTHIEIEKPNVPVWKAAGAITSYVSLNISLSLLNKWLFQNQGFRFPILIIIAGTLTTFIGSLIAVLWFGYLSIPYRSVLKNWKLLAILAISHGLATGLENLSISYISISLNQVIKATVPAGTIFASYLFEGRTFSNNLIVSTVVIVFGAILCVFENPEFETRGVLCAVGSAVITVVQAITSGILLQRCSLNIITITLTTSLPAVASLLPGFMILEYEGLTAHVQKGGGGTTLVILTGISVMAFFYNVSHYLLINYTSAHYSVLIGNMKTVLLVGISMAYWNTKFGFINFVGLFGSLMGFCLYNYFRYQELLVLNEGSKEKEFTLEVEKLIDINHKDEESSSTDEDNHDKDDDKNIRMKLMTTVTTSASDDGVHHLRKLVH